MKKLIWILLLFPILVFGQHSREAFQKQSFSHGGMGSNSMNFEYSQKQQFRNQPPHVNNNYYAPYYSPYYNNAYWWGWGYSNWPYYGAYNYYYPYYWYDNWGYRNPARIYVKDGKQDTVKITVPTTILGFSTTTNNEIGGWMTVGRKNYFIIEYTHSYQIDNSTYYRNMTIQDVRGWNDKELNNQVNSGMFSMGVGTHIKKNLSLYSQLGYGIKTIRKKYFDELYVLSNNGQYSFPYTRNDIFTIKLGGIYHINKVVTKFDYDIVRQNFSVGFGIKL